MASKSKRSRLTPPKNYPRIFFYWVVAIFVIKLGIIFNIDSASFGSEENAHLIDGAWLGADGENYLKGYTALLKDGVFSTEGILNYWPAGYPMIIYLLSFLGKSWVLTTLAVFQSAVFSYAVFYFALALSKTRLKKYAFFVLVIILLNPTLSLNSIAVGYESLTASGLLLAVSIIIKDFVEKNDKKLKIYVLVNSSIFGLLTSVQPRLIVAGILINLFWLITRKGLKSGALLIAASLLVTLFFPATLIYRNQQAIGVSSISTNLGVTMNIGAGDNATGGYMKEGFGVNCELAGTAAQQDNQRVRCVLDWYISNPTKALKLFYNKTIYFWSPWYGPIANGTMARNPWLTISPLKNIASTQDGFNSIYGGFGKMISWLWLLSGLSLLIYGFIILWRLGSLERFIGSMAMIAISTNLLISLISIGDHRFRIPIMGMSLFLQVIGLKTLFKGGKALIVDGPTLR